MTDSDRAPARTDEDREFDAISDAAIWEEARDRLKIFNEAEVDNRKRAKAAMLFREGQQWDDTPTASVSEEEVKLTINLTDAMVRRVVNNMKQQRPRGKCHPVGEGADIEVAEVINGIGRHIETRSEASVAYDLAGERAIDAGVGYFRLIAEYVDPRSFQKDLRILPIRNIFTVAMDPGAIMPSGVDQMWDIISLKMKRTEYKRRYPNAKNVSWADTGADEPQRSEWENKEEIRLAEYFRIREREETLYLIRAADGSEVTKYRSELPRREDGHFDFDHIARKFRAVGAKIEGERDSIKRQVEWFRLNGRMVVERQQIPGSYIPVFRVEGNVMDIDGSLRRRGMVESMMDPQRMVNYGEVAKIKRLGLAPKAPWTAFEGQLDGHPEWETANTVAHPVLVHKPVFIETSSGAQLLPPPTRQQPAQIEAGFSEFVQGMRSNLLAVAGMPNEPGQDRQGEVVSGRAIKRRQWLSDQSHFQYYDNLTLAIAQCWRVMVEWIPFYYSEERMQRIIGEDSTPQMVKINERTEEDGVARVKNDLSVGKYDVVMDTGPGYETKREEGAENLIGLLQVGPLAEIIAKAGADLVFRAVDHPYMQELADRLMAQNPEGLQKILESLSGRARNIVQMLWNQIQALQQQNQQLQQDLKGGITKTLMQTTERAHATEETQTTKRFDTVHRGIVAKEVEEIRAGGKILDSHVDNTHEARQLERQLLHDAEQAAANREATPQQPANGGTQ